MIHPIEAIEAYKLIKNQQKSPEEIKRIQDKKLKRLIKHSYEKVPYYRQFFDSLNLKPEDVQSAEDLPKLPLLSKKIIKSLPLKQMIAKGVDLKKCRTAKTSGTTSEPFQVYFNWINARMIGIALVRSLLACDVKPLYRIGVFSGNPNFPQDKARFNRFGIWRSCKLWPYEKVEDWIKKLKKWKPQVLYGYFMSIILLAETIVEKGIKGINPNVVICTSGVLDNASRQIIHSAFKAKVFDFYGSWEGGNIAWECPQCSGLHINSDMVILEVLKDGKPVSPGQEGEVVITNLYSFVMPFIRYRQGDVVVLYKEEPICGRPFHLIKKIKGRLVDFVILPSGEKLSPLPFNQLMSYNPAIDQYRIVQEYINLLSVEIVPLQNFNQSHFVTIEKELRKLVGQDMKITISLVKKIDFDPEYKRSILLSKVSKNRMQPNSC